MNAPNALSLQPDGPPEFRAPDPLVSADQKLELLEYWRSITKRKWPILGLMLVAAILAGVVAYSLTPIYKASATMLIEATRSRIVSIEDVYSTAPGQSREGLLTQVEVIKSRDVVERAVRREKLWEQPGYDPRQAPPSWRSRFGAVWGISAPPRKWDEEALVAGAVTTAQRQLTVENLGFSQLIKVSFEGPDAALAARMANAVSEAYIQNQRDVRLLAAQQANSALMDNLGELKTKLTDSERALQQYRESHGLVNLGGSTQTLASQQAAAVTSSLSSARTKRLELEGAYRQVTAVTNGDYTSVPWVMRDPAVQDTQRQHNDARRQLAQLSETLGSRNSKVLEAQAQIDSVESTLKRQSAAAADSLRREYEAAVALEQSLDKDLGSVRSSVKDVNRDEFQLAALEREVATNRQLYDMFVTRGKETALSGEVQGAVARFVERAIPVAIPVKPDRPRIIGLAVAAAALLGAAIGLLLDAMDNTIKGADDAEKRLRLPLLTALPVLKEHDRGQMAHLFIASPDSHFSEAIRTARTGVMLSNIDRPHKTLLVTSTVPGEGKTTLAINLAIAHAQTRRTLIIDADMRRPQVAQRLGLDHHAKGLTNLVAGDATLDQCLQSVVDSSLQVMSVGDLPPNPLELLLSQRLEQVLTQLKVQFDIIIIDSPPVGLVSDALVLAPKATSTILVVRAMATPTPLARKSITRLQRAGANILGIVLNGLDFGRAEKYYGEHSAGNGYAYGYGYGDDDGPGYGYGAGRHDKKGNAKGKGTPALVLQADVDANA